ncbi:MAG: hypothetical protein IJK31_03300 [Ruminococcus sp.]|nr:hypothetical protein [Ruminococcus sp.]HRR77134.1 hypothetical protein [Ruminococcus sp.]
MDMKKIAVSAAAGTAAGLAWYAFSSAGPIKKMSIKKDAGRTLKAAGDLFSDLKSALM